MNVEEVFLAALDQPDAKARALYLEQTCGGDTQFRRQVEDLLAAHYKSGEFLDVPAAEQLGAGSGFEKTIVPGDAMSGEKNGDEDLEFLSPATRPDSLGRIGHYEVLQVLGKGGFGIVFRAFDDVLQRVVAIKVLAPQLAATSPARKRFLREAQSSAKVRHENVVQVHEVGEHPLPHLVMEFIPGETLQERLDRVGPLDVLETLRIGRQIAEGLAAAHANDLIHRDIKPGNVLLEGAQLKVKITDFGLARAADDASISQSGIIAGTPMYMAPEQAHGQPIDRRADLFSLGSVLYQMVAGRPPFRANTTVAVLKRVAEDTPRSIREIIPETPQWLCDIIARLHAKNPDDRYQSAREVADVLADCEAQLKQNSKLKDFSRIPRSQRPAAGKSGPRKWIAAAAIVLLPVLALAVTEFAGVTRLFRNPPDGTGRLEVRCEDTTLDLTLVSNSTGRRMHYRSDDSTFSAGRATLTLPGGPYTLTAHRDGKLHFETGIFVFAQTATPIVVPKKPPETLASASPQLPAVNLSTWGTFVDPRGECSQMRTGNLVSIVVPGTRPYGLSPAPGNQDAPRLLQDVEGDFLIQVTVPPYARPKPNTSTGAPSTRTEWDNTSSPAKHRPNRPASYRAAGLLVWVDEQTFLRFERASSGEQLNGAPYLNRHWYIAGQSGVPGDPRLMSPPMIPDAPTHLQIERRGQVLYLRRSYDGRTWFEANTVSNMELPRRVSVGLVASNSTNTEFTAAFDNLRLRGRETSPAESGWVQLFNGKDLGGWKTNPAQPGDWSVLDGYLLARPGSRNSTLFYTARQFEDFHLRVQAKINGPGDSGVFFRARFDPLIPYTPEVFNPQGYESQIVWNDVGRIGLLKDEQFSKVISKGKAVEADRWFTLELIAKGDHLRTIVNGAVIGETNDDTLSRGLIGLQYLGAKTEVQFAKIEIKELPPDAASFVILAKDKRRETLHATLADAVKAAQSGDIIEIRGDGPFVVSSEIDQGDKALAIRAAAGCRPVIKGDIPGKPHKALITTKGRLVLEGLDFWREGQDQEGFYGILTAHGPSLHVANCRLFVKGPGSALVAGPDVRECEIRNSLLLSADWHPLDSPSRTKLTVENCVLAGQHACLLLTSFPGEDGSIRLQRNTWVGNSCLEVRLFDPPSLTPDGKFAGKLRIVTASNLFANNPFVKVGTDHGFAWVHTYTPTEKLSPSTAVKFLREALAWEGNKDLHARNYEEVLLLWKDGTNYQAVKVKDLPELAKYFATGSAALPDALRFQGGKLHDRIAAAPEDLKPEDFRLADGSAGKGKAEGGKDVGADVDLIGPGAAYEKWKKTKEHEEWRKQSSELWERYDKGEFQN